MINTHITTFSGLPNLNLPLDSSTTLPQLFAALNTRLSLSPQLNSRLLLSTTSGLLLRATDSTTTLSSLAGSNDLLTLRLTVPLCGGKGGFGSQLRAAGGRMSSRKKNQENSDSCRNLDGRRMRTVKEAKALAAWLEVKPEMEKKEREERMKRWRDIVESVERRDEGQDKKRFDDVEWLEGLEEGKERTREAVLKSLRDAGLVEEDSSGESSGDEVQAEGSTSAVKRAVEAALKEKEKPVEMKFRGWDDEDDEFLSSDDEDMEDIAEEDEVDVKGKGKAKA
jgi:hypothetical protein